jgi:hypothetical protein
MAVQPGLARVTLDDWAIRQGDERGRGTCVLDVVIMVTLQVQPCLLQKRGRGRVSGRKGVSPIALATFATRGSLADPDQLSGTPVGSGS